MRNNNNNLCTRENNCNNNTHDNTHNNTHNTHDDNHGGNSWWEREMHRTLAGSERQQWAERFAESELVERERQLVVSERQWTERFALERLALDTNRLAAGRQQDLRALQNCKSD